jgi:hypothetical protein
MHDQRTVAEMIDGKATAILTFVFELHPAHIHLDEMMKEMARDPANAADRDDVNVALNDLVRVGLLHRQGEFVFASRAAVRGHELRG